MITEAFSCKRGQNTIRGFVYRPEGTNLPLLIASHGFMSTNRTIKLEAKRLAEMGFAVVACDFCGGSPKSKSDGSTTEMSVLTEVEDLLAIIDAAAQLDYVNGDDLTLCGFSQGGFVSAIVAAKLKERVKRLILFYPALCIPDDARSGRMMFARFDPNDLPDRIRCGPMLLGRCYPADVMDIDPYVLIQDYKGPVLLIHGTDDTIVSQRYIEQVFQTYLTSQGGTPSANCQMVLIHRGNHGLSGPLGKKWLDYAFFAIEKFLQGKAPVLNVDVKLTKSVKSKHPGGKKVHVYFDGESNSPFFQGMVDDGAYDEQIFRMGFLKSCHAVYTIRGKDCKGKPCTVSVTNHMDAEKNKGWSRGWVPTVSSDSPNLKFLNEQQCEVYAEMRKTGPYIHVYADPQKDSSRKP